MADDAMSLLYGAVTKHAGNDFFLACLPMAIEEIGRKGGSVRDAVALAEYAASGKNLEEQRDEHGRWAAGGGGEVSAPSMEPPPGWKPSRYIDEPKMGPTPAFLHPGTGEMVPLHGAKQFSSTFVVGNQKYAFHAYSGNYDRGWEITFQNETSIDHYGITGTGNAHRVFAMVSDSMNQFIEQAKPEAFHFSAAEPSRVSLYNAMVPRIEKQGYKFVSRAGTTFKKGRIYKFKRIEN